MGGDDDHGEEENQLHGETCGRLMFQFAKASAFIPDLAQEVTSAYSIENRFSTGNVLFINTSLKQAKLSHVRNVGVMHMFGLLINYYIGPLERRISSLFKVRQRNCDFIVLHDYIQLTY